MRKRELSISRLIIFIVGLVILEVGIILLLPSYLMQTWRGTFICIFLLLIYIGNGMPLIFNYIDDSRRGGLFIGGAIYYRGMRLYSLISIVLIVLTAMMILPLRIAVGGEVLDALIVIIYSYLAIESKHHIDNVADNEYGKTITLNTLKHSVMELKVKTERCSGDREDIRNRVNKLAENFRYLTPSDKPQAIDLENRMLEEINYLTTFDMTATNNSGSDDYIRQQLTELEDLYKTRKNIY